MGFEEDRIELTGTLREKFVYDIVNGHRNGVLYKEDENGRFVPLNRIPEYGIPYYEVRGEKRKSEIRLYYNKHENDNTYQLIRGG